MIYEKCPFRMTRKGHFSSYSVLKFAEQVLGIFKIAFLLLLFHFLCGLRQDVKSDKPFPLIKERKGLICIIVRQQVIDFFGLFFVFKSIASYDDLFSGFFHSGLFYVYHWHAS